MDRFVVISGCSGGGKSTLLAELGRRGHSTVEEPGRRIVAQELQQGGKSSPLGGRHRIRASCHRHGLGGPGSGSDFGRMGVL
jgi:predicted ATPase